MLGAWNLGFCLRELCKVRKLGELGSKNENNELNEINEYKETVLELTEIDKVVLNLPPIRLESLLKICYKEKDKGGGDVPISVRLMQNLG